MEHGNIMLWSFKKTFQIFSSRKERVIFNQQYKKNQSIKKNGS